MKNKLQQLSRSDKVPDGLNPTHICASATATRGVCRCNSLGQGSGASTIGGLGNSRSQSLHEEKRVSRS
jgi:hypothetical protein